ncbi:hypothetical protein [Chitinophaga tropicalis]|uniref:Uncharacterized protein n=1 Tax=Chitinophaga tropicalis TaxID=2683588 RepID=A0A7K1UAH0_9BACT|nr:hypothetical protein [Chitinophaga tropicalis]MVT11374.1 hypothetical protein [Chitinophaga tropicalis]
MITAITVQPTSNSLHAAYRPIVFQVTAVSLFDTFIQPPVVYCDIYFGGVYYKTVSKTIPLASGEWQFDIQDAAQEYLRKYLAPNAGTEFYQATPAMTKSFCRFRASGINTNGFVVPEGLIPVQGTGSQPPVNGGGTESNSFYIVNATLQHEDNQNLAAHLNTYKNGTWSAQAWPLTHRPQPYPIGLSESDYYPIAYTGISPLKCINVYYRFRGQTTFHSATKCLENPCPIVQIVHSEVTVIDETAQELQFFHQVMPYYVTGVKMEYRPINSEDDFTVIFYDPEQGSTPGEGIEITVPRDIYDVYFTAIGNCSGGRTAHLVIGETL